LRSAMFSAIAAHPLSAVAASLAAAALIALAGFPVLIARAVPKEHQQTGVSTRRLGVLMKT